MNNEEIRQVLKLWGESGQIERYRFAFVSDEFKKLINWALISAFAGFVSGFLLGVLTH